MAGGGATLQQEMRDNAAATPTAELRWSRMGYELPQWLAAELRCSNQCYDDAGTRRRRNCFAAGESYELLPWRAGELRCSSRCCNEASPGRQ